MNQNKSRFKRNSLIKAVSRLRGSLAKQASVDIDQTPEEVEDKEAKIPLTSSSNHIVLEVIKPKFEDYCLPEEDPFYIHKLARTERLDEFSRYYYENPGCLYLRDDKKWQPIHYAVSRARLNIIEFILKKSDSKIINEADYKGNTPLHIAIENDRINSCKFLLDHNCDVRIRNKEYHAPIHYCIVKNKPDILELLLEHKNSVEIHYTGEHGGTALHYCANYDDEECAKILIKHGSDMCVKCANGFFPIHLAATRCSNKVMKYLLDEASRLGCPKLNVLSYVDSDYNKPLHTAVQFGNVGAVRLCLESGALINEVIESDHSTAVHLACAQGSLDILKLMFDKQPHLKDVVIYMQDIHLMTPLHKAAMFDHVDVVEYLVERGSSIDSLDREKRSALLLAASHLKMRSFLHLLADYQSVNDAGAKTRIGIDAYSQNLCAAIFGVIRSPNILGLFNQQDFNGCTLMHYLSRLDQANCIKPLLDFGANVSIKDHEKQSPLHYTAKYGRYNSCLQILLSPNYKNYINEKDNNGCTPLHLASQNGHCKVVRLLMEKGALIYRSYNGNTPFHEAALHSYTNTMAIIFNVDPNVIDMINKDEDTALHLAAKEGHANVVDYLLSCGAKFILNKDNHTFLDEAIMNKQHSVLLKIIAHPRWQEAMDLSSTLYETPFLGIIEFSSEITTAVLQRCIVKEELADKNCKIKYIFKYLNTPKNVDGTAKKRNEPLLPLSYMVKYGRKDCLLHELCQTFLYRKWNVYGFKLYSISTLLYLIFLSFFTLLVVSYPKCASESLFDSNNNEAIENSTLTNKTENCNEISRNVKDLDRFLERTNMYPVFVSYCLFFSFLSLLKELYQVITDSVTIITTFQFQTETVLYVTTIIFLVPFVYIKEEIIILNWTFGCIAIFTAWLNLLLYVQRFYVLGIYVIMFTEILKTLFKVISLFSILIIGFGIVFYVLLDDRDPRYQTTPVVSVVHTIFMMMGDLNSYESFVLPYVDDSKYTLYYGTTTILFMILFVFLIPILLTNLLIGLAVGDIDAILNSAQLKREAMQVQLHIELEKRLPEFILKKIAENEYSYVFNRKKFKKSFCAKFVSLFKTLQKREEAQVTNDLSSISDELTKQKKDISSLRSLIEHQTDLLRLIVEKIEITNDIKQGIESGCAINNCLAIQSTLDLEKPKLYVSTL